MPAMINLGFWKGDYIAQCGNVSFGLNIVQNRNSTKQNISSFNVGDGLTVQPLMNHLNVDSDMIDMPNFDAADFAAPQM